MSKFVEVKKNLLRIGKIAFEIDFWDENLRKFYPEIESSILIEEFIDGTSFPLENNIFSGKTTILRVTEKKWLAKDKPRNKTFHFPSANISLKILIRLMNLLKM